jgi:hypothetical protein
LASSTKSLKPKSQYVQRVTLIILLALLHLLCPGQETIVVPSQFVEAAVPEVGSDKWRALNYSRNEFDISILNGHLEISKIDRNNKSELKIANGTLTGIDHGEWGGSLTFTPDDTTAKKVELKSGNVKFIFKFESKIYFIEGIAHMGMSSGALYELNIENSNFTYKKLIDFDDAPDAFAIYHNTFFIASYMNFYIIKDFKKELVLKDTFWEGLYPNSIAVFDEKNVFIGLRGGIARIDLTTKNLKFYQNDK